jgi:Uma2 family endonuclease
MTPMMTKEALPEPARMKWTREQYYSLLDSNALTEDSKVELIGGEILTEGMLDRMTQGSRHSAEVGIVRDAVAPLIPRGTCIRVQVPISLGTDSDPEPDIAIVPGTQRDYMERHPNSAIIKIEVSDTTLRFDRTYKASLYASAVIPEYWIVNLAARQLEVHRQPIIDAGQPFGYRYGSVMAYTGRKTVTPLGAANGIAVNELLP